MGRDSGPVCRKCRSYGVKLFLKGRKCLTAKCPLEMGRLPPGMHGMARRSRKLSEYGVQLMEKQRLKFQYGIRERQLRNIFDKAVKSRGVVGERLLQLLELRLDNVVWRLGFAMSRRQARQMVRHGHIIVNGRKVDIPSYTLKEGDVIGIRNKEKSLQLVRRNKEFMPESRISSWLAFDAERMEGKVLHVPSRNEIDIDINEQLIVELYSR